MHSSSLLTGSCTPSSDSRRRHEAKRSRMATRDGTTALFYGYRMPEKLLDQWCTRTKVRLPYCVGKEWNRPVKFSMKAKGVFIFDLDVHVRSDGRTGEVRDTHPSAFATSDRTIGFGELASPAGGTSGEMGAAATSEVDSARARTSWEECILLMSTGSVCLYSSSSTLGMFDTGLSLPRHRLYILVERHTSKQTVLEDS